MLNKMAKISVKLLCLLLVFAMLAGCGGNGNKTNNDAGTAQSGTESTGKDRPTGGTSATGVNPEEYRGSTVVYATWKNPHQNENSECPSGCQGS